MRGSPTNSDHRSVSRAMSQSVSTLRTISATDRRSSAATCDFGGDGRIKAEHDVAIPFPVALLGDFHGKSYGATLSFFPRTAFFRLTTVHNSDHLLSCSQGTDELMAAFSCARLGECGSSVGAKHEEIRNYCRPARRWRFAGGGAKWSARAWRQSGAQLWSTVNCSSDRHRNSDQSSDDAPQKDVHVGEDHPP
jgi:hypothetical protein